MKRILAFCLILLMTGFAHAEEIDISGLSEQELKNLHSQIVQQLAIAKSGDVVYDQDGISIAWVGFTEWGDYGFICQNKTGKDWHFAVIGFGMNGIKVDPSSNGMSVEFPDGMALYTAGYFNWLFDKDVYKELNLTHVREVYIQIGLYDGPGLRFIEEPTLKISISFPVDEEISAQVFE